MKFRAIHHKQGYQDAPIDDETVVIISIEAPDYEQIAEVIYVREDGSLGQDTIANFTITEGAW